MTRKIIWLVASCVMVLSLVIASCGGAAEEEEQAKVEEEAEMVKVTLTKKDGAKVELMKEKPEYGGTLTHCAQFTNFTFDNVLQGGFNGVTFQLTNEGAMQKDWAKGPSGTGENSFRTASLPPSLDQYAPSLAESWELPDDSTIIWHFRKGVHWHDTYPANGREFVADDYKKSIDRHWFNTPGSFFSLSFPYIEEITCPDKYTAVVKTKEGYNGIIWEETGINKQYECPDIIEEFGDGTDWKNACGTGPYILKDFIEGSSATLERNKDYYLPDPFFPKNKLPYLDKVVVLIIADESTRIAAIRTAKLDHLGNQGTMLTWNNASDLMNTNPELKYTWNYSTGYGITGIADDPSLPYSDIRVRKALCLAIDQDAYVNDYFRGEATKYYQPFRQIEEMKLVNIAPEDYPADIKELYEYKPDKAKQLLAEAGYPDGFVATVTCDQTYVDVLSIAKDMLSKVGIDLNIQVEESATFRTIRYGRENYELIPVGNMECGDPRTGSFFKAVSQFNPCKINDPFFEDIYHGKLDRSFMDDDARNGYVKQVCEKALNSVYIVPFAADKQYTFWQPWVKGFNGEFSVMYSAWWGWPKYVWVDQDMKARLLGK